MPVDFRKFRRKIEEAGYLIQQTAKGHYWIVTPKGDKLEMFAAGHGKGRKNEVLDVYVHKIWRAIETHKASEQQEQSQVNEGGL